ncbi:MAG: aldehyde dehydrogenase family protein [Ilumatobacteraceae bacterium]|nr:aldehyde dehydrogenase family protein [Ilumatobacteraceae bacterium]MBL6759766.1 aldehyde dehydrogenase family protein [Ilumatobacteraceae bacterium]
MSVEPNEGKWSARIGALRDATPLLREASARAERLKRLEDHLREHEAEYAAVLNADLGKSETEAWLTEIGFIIGQSRYARRHLREWMRPRRVSLPAVARPGRGRVVPTPLGVVCVIAPWNYPLHLALAPVVAAVAAGNTVVVKPSELAPRTADLIASHLPTVLGTDICEVVTGGAEITSGLLQERFDHIFYTGGGRVGRIVMEAASRHLTPVTLELGGRSPAIVCADADLSVSARRIVWGKFVNAGQTCVAPDHVLVEREVADRLISLIGDEIEAAFGADASTSPDYGRIVNTHHVDRLTALIRDSGASTVIGGQVDRDARYIAPTVLVEPDASSSVLADEIFGPVLPIVVVEDLDAELPMLTKGPTPLALYVFTGSDERARKVLELVPSGGAVVNHTLLHLAVHELPLGGKGESGHGSYHGRAGFDRLSHLRSVLQRPTRPDPRIAYPPYGRVAQRLLRRLTG